MFPGTREDLRGTQHPPLIPKSKIEKLGDSPSHPAVSDVWPGEYREDEEGKGVAIKAIRYRQPDDVQRTKKVRHFDLFSSHDRT